MNVLKKLINSASQNARKKRTHIFLENFPLDEHTKILDLGSGNGAHIHSVVADTRVAPNNVYIADIKPDALNQGKDRYGYTPVLLTESEALPFPHHFFDIVFCSSVIEHVTLPKTDIWNVYSGQAFKHDSAKRQKSFADEIKRLGKQYFVQTPYKYFPIDSHTWLPFTAWLPRVMLIPVMKFTNLFWIKKARPDWYLFNKKRMSEMFNDATILEEKSLWMTKSLIAIRKI